MRKIIYFFILRFSKRVPLNSSIRSKLPNLSNFFVKNVKTDEKKYLMRQLWDGTYNSQTILNEETLPEIDVLICCSAKDERSLSKVIESVFKKSLNPINLVTIISPQILDLSAIHLPKTIKMQNILDNEILNQENFDFINSIVPKERFGWAIQQVLKIKYSLESKARYILIIDSDTILLKPHAFVNAEGVQSISISYEKHMPYLEHSNRYFNTAVCDFSYVTHYQLWQTSFINEIYPNGIESIYRWLKLVQKNEVSGFSEFHTYGVWLVNQHPLKKVVVTWRNTSIPLSKWLAVSEKRSDTLASLGPLNSISVHSYL